MNEGKGLLLALVVLDAVMIGALVYGLHPWATPSGCTIFVGQNTDGSYFIQLEGGPILWRGTNWQQTITIAMSLQCQGGLDQSIPTGPVRYGGWNNQP